MGGCMSEFTTLLTVVEYSKEICMGVSYLVMPHACMSDGGILRQPAVIASQVLSNASGE